MEMSGLYSQNSKSLFHDLLNQYQACLYLFECTSHGDSKYVNDIQRFLQFLTIFVTIFLSSALHTCRGGSVKALVYRWSVEVIDFHHPIR